MPSDQYIALVRDPRAPVAGPIRAATARLETIFLHGDGVEYAATESGMSALNSTFPCDEIIVCASSWRRRMAATKPAGQARAGTLMEFFDRLDRAGGVCCIGLGGHSMTRHDPDSGLCIQIGFAPATDRQHLEALEFALAAAAIELDAEVRFIGPGCEHLAGERARGWRQFIDHDLMPLIVDSGAGRDAPPAELPVRVQPIADASPNRTILKL